MKKDIGRKSVLKDAGVLLIASLMILSAIVVTANTTNKGGRTVFLWEGFEAGVMPPTGWTLNDPSNNWVITTSAFSGTYAAKFYDATASKIAELISPSMDWSAMPTVLLSFWLKQPYATGHDTLMVRVSIDGGSTWTSVAQYSGNITKYTHQTIDLTDYAGYSNVKVCFMAIGLGGNGIYLDEIRISDAIDATEFMGLEVAPLGLADLAIIDDSLSVSNCVSGLNETDGVWTNLNDSYNQYDVVIKNPFNSLPVLGIPGEVLIFCGEEPIVKLLIKAVVGGGATGKALPPCPSNAAEGWARHKNGFTLVFYKEHIMTGAGGLLDIGYFKGQCDYLGYDFGNRLSMGLTFSSPIEWTWPEQGVNNLSVDRIEIVPENMNETAYSYSNMYTNNIPAFNITEMQAGVNNPPSKPTIDGPASGKILTKYDYKITSTDDVNDSLYYLVDWGDGSEISFIGPYPPGDEVTASHTWLKKGTYTVRAKAMDQYYSESDWATLQVTMPKARMVNQPFPLINWLFERFPHMFPILRHLIGLYQ